MPSFARLLHALEATRGPLTWASDVESLVHPLPYAPGAGEHMQDATRALWDKAPPANQEMRDAMRALADKYPVPEYPGHQYAAGGAVKALAAAATRIEPMFKKVGEYLGMPIHEVTNPDFRVLHGTGAPWEGKFDPMKAQVGEMSHSGDGLGSLFGPHVTDDYSVANGFAAMGKPNGVGANIMAFQPKRVLDATELMKKSGAPDDEFLHYIVGHLGGAPWGNNAAEDWSLGGYENFMKYLKPAQKKAKDLGIDAIKYSNSVEQGMNGGEDHSYLLAPHVKAGFKAGGHVTEAQKAAGNYAKEHRNVGGMRVSIENKAGSTRSGTAPDGTQWESKMAHDYGYIRGTRGADKDHIDAFFGPGDPAEHPVHVIDQVHPDTGAFDEHKVMFGFPDEQSALDGYHANYEPGWRGADSVNAMPFKDFKQWAFKGPQRKPFAEGGAVFGNPNIARQGAKAGATLERPSDYQSVHTPTTAFLAGLLGSPPDQIDSSVLDPQHADLQRAALPGYLLSTVSQMRPFASPALKGARAVLNSVPAASIANVPLSQMGAVKLPGGNWVPEGLNRELKRMAYTGPVKDWFDGPFSKYAKNQLGATADPLLKLEAEGRMHLAPDDLRELSSDRGIAGASDRGGKYPLDPLKSRDQFHLNATGRNYRTPWENLSDAAIENKPTGTVGLYKGISKLETGSVPSYGATSVGELKRNGTLPALNNKYDYLDKLPTGSPVYDAYTPDLGFDHVRDYLRAATEAHGQPQTNALVARGLSIDPAKLSRMSVPDVVAKTAEWNKVLAAQAQGDLNKGIKSVLKTYPTGHQWVELDPEGLGAEGAAMKHCVGGYCSQVEDGSARILSLRDKNNKPAVTVEVSPGELNVPKEHQEAFDALRSKATDEAMQHPDYLARPDTMGAREFDNTISPIQERMAKEVGIPVSRYPSTIQQIKGPSNKAPPADAIPHIQDLVKTMGPWDSVGDIDHAGLIDTSAGAARLKQAFPGAQGRESALAQARAEGKLQPYMSQQEWEDAITPYLPQQPGAN